MNEPKWLSYDEKRDPQFVEARDKAGDKILGRWYVDANGRITEVMSPNQSKSSLFRSLRNMRQAVTDAFLPIGYPDSVSPDYLAYQTYDSLQAFFSTIVSLLASRAVLQGLGVGDASSSVTSALLLTILKDAVARIATIQFAYRFGLAIEPDAKRYRFLADLYNDGAFLLDLISPHLPSTQLKILVLVLAEAYRAFCGVAAGASKAALSNHFARSNNLAELNAKEASQETAVGLLGLLAGSLVVRAVESREAVIVLMIALVFAHLWMNYLGIRCVQLRTINHQRAMILCKHYLKTGLALTPAEVAEQERIVGWIPVLRDTHGQAVCRVRIIENFAEAADHTQAFDWDHVRMFYVPGKPASSTSPIAKKAEFLIMAKRQEMFRTDGRENSSISSEAGDFLAAWGLAVKLAKDASPPLRSNPALVEETKCGFSNDLPYYFTKAGWRTDEHIFETGMPVRMRFLDGGLVEVQTKKVN